MVPFWGVSGGGDNFRVRGLILNCWPPQLDNLGCVHTTMSVVWRVLFLIEQNPAKVLSLLSKLRQFSSESLLVVTKIRQQKICVR